MNKQDKFVIKIATWVVDPDGYAYLSSAIDDSEDVSRNRHKKMMRDPFWNGYKFIRVPITIPVPNEIENKVAKEEDND